MKFAEMKDMTAEELKSKEGDMRRELFNLRFQAATGEIQNPSRIKHLRKDIARLLTAASQKSGGAKT